ncbi:MAG: hypothetical protein ASARMPREDX12_009195 [Alectoria sarmentosa]|nr:MAG: hypothetical protein ASARMPREDX12_009195 [Alectoria sarmentosa]
MASALTASPYISQSPVYTRSPQPPPSPPIDEPNNLRTLPSIQSLIGMDVPPSNDEQHLDAEGQPIEQQPQGGEHQTAGHRPHTYGQPTVSNPNAVPPSPPIDPQLGFDASHQSPSATSSHSSTSGPQYFGGTINNPDPTQQRQPPPSSTHPGQTSSQATQSPYQSSPYPPSPSAGSSYSYPSPAVTGGQTLYYQRPLPNNFPPPNVPSASNPSIPNSQDASPIDLNNPSQWQQQHQHHHYIAPSSSTNFTGQSQDRLPPSSHSGPPTIYPSLQALHPCPEAFDDITYMAYFVKLGLEVINLAQDVSEAGDFSVGRGDGGVSARGLVESGALGLRCELERYEQAIAEHEAAKRMEQLDQGEQGCAFLLDGAVKRT